MKDFVFDMRKLVERAHGYIPVDNLDVAWIPNPNYDEALNVLREANGIEPDPEYLMLRPRSNP